MSPAAHRNRPHPYAEARDTPGACWCRLIAANAIHEPERVAAREAETDAAQHEHRRRVGEVD